MRLLAIHNLAYLERLMRGAREAIAAGRFDDYRRGTLGGEAPWELASGRRRADAHCVWSLMNSLSWSIWSGIVCLIRSVF